MIDENEKYEILDNVPEGVMILNNNFEIIFANKVILETYDLPKEKILGNFCYKVTHNQDVVCAPPGHVCPIEEYRKTGKITEAIHKHYDKDGKGFFVTTVAYPIMDDGGEVKKYIHIAKVLTEEMQRNINDFNKFQFSTIDYYKEMDELKKKIADLESRVEKEENK